MNAPPPPPAASAGLVRGRDPPAAMRMNTAEALQRQPVEQTRVSALGNNRRKSGVMFHFSMQANIVFDLWTSTITLYHTKFPIEVESTVNNGLSETSK